ncbi:PAS domain-containing hybrid sensor histidine kinase/response regulator [Oligoflexus sp.]|uniref:PAS domain-containing hybrid sensor histidine kinase/response regulator n=1 Tax=Oligoflexus sp. TaxID=1971216 RepID=UPI002D76B496|nr:ATP-binding protein [Oligoflexus sp.]
MIRKDVQGTSMSGIVDMKRLVHELQTHKIELEMQNDELRRAELRLRQSTRRYADLYDFAPVGYITLSKHGVVRELNLKGAAVLQKDRVLLIGALIHDYIDPGYGQAFKQHLADLLTSGQRQSCKVKIKTSDGEPFHVHVESIVWFDEDSGEYSIRSILNDVTTQVRIEAELVKAKERAEQASQAKSQFLANMSHEIRTPLAVMLGYSDLVLLDLDSDSPFIKPIDGIKKNGEHLLQVIDDILDISRVEAGEVVVSMGPCDPVQEILDIVESMRHKAEARGLSLHIQVQDGIPATIRSDATRIRQIVINLINNAIKFTESGSISLVISHQSTPAADGIPQLLIDVKDTGIGIPDEAQISLFKAFSQLDPSHSRKFGGIGLGLYLSQRLAQALGGAISLVESRVGSGSTFRLSMKMQVVQDKVEARSPKSPYKVEKSELKGTTILLVDDSIDNQFVIRRMIEMAGGTVYCAEDGQSAISMAFEKPIDLILMDLQLPLLDGYQATAELRRHQFKKPVLALTAHALQSERDRVLNSPDFDDFLSKPIGLRPLVDTVKKWTRRNCGSGSSPTVPLH